MTVVCSSEQTSTSPAPMTVGLPLSMANAFRPPSTTAWPPLPVDTTVVSTTKPSRKGRPSRA